MDGVGSRDPCLLHSGLGSSLYPRGAEGRLEQCIFLRATKNCRIVQHTTCVLLKMVTAWIAQMPRSNIFDIESRARPD